jgi:hypothetical protein
MDIRLACRLVRAAILLAVANLAAYVPSGAAGQSIRS